MARSDQLNILSRAIELEEDYLVFLKAQYPEDKASLAISRRDIEHSKALKKLILQYRQPDESFARDRAIAFVEDMKSD
jgi:hypothetical protein